MTFDRIARNEQIVQLYEQGHSLRSLAKRFGLSHEGVRLVILHHDPALLQQPDQERKKHRQELLQKIKQLEDRGQSIAEIATILGLSISYVQSLRREMPSPPRSCPVCGRDFYKRGRGWTCSDVCGTIWRSHRSLVDPVAAEERRLFIACSAVANPLSAPAVRRSATKLLDMVRVGYLPPVRPTRYRENTTGMKLLAQATGSPDKARERLAVTQQQRRDPELLAKVAARFQHRV